MRFLGLEGNIRILAVQVLLGQLGLGMFYVIWQPYFIETGLTLGQLGLVQTVVNLSNGIALFFWGFLSDRYGRKPVLSVSLLLRALSIACLLISDSFQAFLVFGFLMGFTSMFTTGNLGNPARTALITESVDSTQRGTAMSTLTSIAQSVSTVVAPIGGYLALRTGYTFIFTLMVIGDTLGSYVIYRYIKETLINTEQKNQVTVSDLLKNIFSPETHLIKLYLVMLTMGLTYTIMYSLLFGALVDIYGFTTLQLGFMTGAFNLIWALDSIPLGKLVDRIGSKNGMLISNFMALITPIGLLLTRRIEYIMILYAIQALDMGFWIPSYSSFIAESVNQDKLGTVYGKLDAYGKIGGLPGALIAGALYESYGFTAPLYVQIVGMTLSTILIFSLTKRK